MSIQQTAVTYSHFILSFMPYSRVATRDHTFHLLSFIHLELKHYRVITIMKSNWNKIQTKL